jgi:hypothetical protein
MPSKRQSVAIASLLVLVFVIPSVLFASGRPLNLTLLTEVDENRLTEVTSLVDWASTNIKMVRLDELSKVSGENGSRPFVLRFDDVRDRRIATPLQPS